MKILEGTVASVPPQGGRKHPHQELIQIDTTNILFICGGAFDGIDKIIENRIGKNTLGFGGTISGKVNRDIGKLLRQLAPQDLLKFGLIPEFVGRLPVVAALDLLDEDALVSILTEPKNSLVKQYQLTFELDGVILEFEREALLAIAKKAMSINTGARGLRAIIEESIMDIMFEVPSDPTIERVVVMLDCITRKAPPLVVHNQNRAPLKKSKARRQRQSPESA